MKILDMPCPHGWNNCTDCKNVDLCKVGLYKPESSDLDILILAAKIAEEVVTADAIESAQKIRGTWMEELDRVAGTDEFWTWFYKDKRASNLHAVEPIPLDGPSSPGGSKSRNHKKPKKEKPEYMKILGM